MGSYHQMGHQSDNLIDEPELAAYDGAILSPVNYTLEEMLKKVTERHQNREGFEIIFDPQMYFPRTERKKLTGWPYFPDDFDTIDLSSHRWWQNLNSKLVALANIIKPDAVCSPLFIPPIYSADYFLDMVNITEDLADKLSDRSINILQTIVVRLPNLTNSEQVMEIASVLTSKAIDRVYLVFVDDTEPRRERDEPEGLKGAMLLINLLQTNNIRVLVGYTSSEVVLWKHAGASDCATGKYFNLRRFTPSRWDEPSDGGGGQLPYWFEESLMGFLRESDLARIIRVGLLSQASNRNPFADEIITCVRNGEPPWLGLSWRHYLYWFADIEMRLDKHETDVLSALRDADRNWELLEDGNIFMEERKNDGRWIRQWMRAVAEYQN